MDVIKVCAEQGRAKVILALLRKSTMRMLTRDAHIMTPPLVNIVNYTSKCCLDTGHRKRKPHARLKNSHVWR